MRATIAKVLLASTLFCATLAVGKAEQHELVKSAVAPVYPAIAATANTSGDVQVTVTLNAHGDVAETTFDDGNPLFKYAVLEAAKRWKFESGTDHRKVKLLFSFRMMPKETSVEEMTPIFMPPYHLEVRRKLPEPTVNYGESFNLPP
jgi:TonB family protein